MSKKKNKWIIGTVSIIVFSVIVLFCIAYFNTENKNDITSATLEEQLENSINLGQGMYITSTGKYTGVYMEDGTDEIVSDVAMITVENKGNSIIQYAEITIPTDEGEANFSLSTLVPGGKMILLEKNRMRSFADEVSTAVADNIAIFSEPVSLCEDKVKLQILDGAINVTNISGKDIERDILIYYKNYVDGIYYGGITYRVKLENGLKGGEIRQIMADHFSETNSRIMFVTCGE